MKCPICKNQTETTMKKIIKEALIKGERKVFKIGNKYYIGSLKRKDGKKN